MSLSAYVDTLTLLGDESRLRLCALLRDRELCVTDLVRVTGIAQSRVSTHLGRLREAGFVRDRRQGAQCFYALAENELPPAAQAVLECAGGAVLDPQGRDLRYGLSRPILNPNFIALADRGMKVPPLNFG